MAPRAYWKGYLKLSLVSCPIALFPATSEREKIRFHQVNKKTGNRIKYRKVDAETGDEVESDNIIKGYEVGKSQYIELDPEELEAVEVTSSKPKEVEHEFVDVVGQIGLRSLEKSDRKRKQQNQQRQQQNFSNKQQGQKQKNQQQKKQSPPQQRPPQKKK